MEKILTDIVKEKGISKIIMDYKKEFENLMFCNMCNCEYDDIYDDIWICADEAHANYSNHKIGVSFCGDCLMAGYEVYHDEWKAGYDRYRLGRHGVYRKVSDEDY